MKLHASGNSEIDLENCHPERSEGSAFLMQLHKRVPQPFAHLLKVCESTTPFQIRRTPTRNLESSNKAA
jgi:hypothetical protein